MAETFDPNMDPKLDSSRRTALVATTAVGAVGALGVAVPFVGSFQPSERAKAAGAPVEVDISGLAAGEKSPRRVARQAGVDRPPHARDAGVAEEDRRPGRRSEVRDALLLPDTRRTPRTSTARSSPSTWSCVGICSHLGCSPTDKFQPGPQPSLPDDWPGGFFCPCHGSTFDLAGRVFKNKPAPDNLDVPPHMYLSDTRSADRRRQERA